MNLLMPNERKVHRKTFIENLGIIQFENLEK